MIVTLKKYFIPHEGNNYHPHILHTKRAFFYSAVFLVCKMFVVAFVIFLPMEVFGLPDVLAEEQRQIIALTNQVRAERQRKILGVSDKLDRSAQYKSDDMVAGDYFAHAQGSKGLAYWLFKAGYNYETAGENLAVGYATADEVVAAWVNSPTHYANLIDSDYKDFGVGLTSGYFNGEPTVFIAQHFGSPMLSQELPLSQAKIAKKSVASMVVPASSTEVLLSDTTTFKQNLVMPAPARTEEIASSSLAETVISTLVFSSSTSVLSFSALDESSTTDAVVLSARTAATAESVPIINSRLESPLRKYIFAKSTLSPITNIFKVERVIYLAAMAFFAVALLLKIGIEIKKQHPHIILQTAALVTLLFILWSF